MTEPARILCVDDDAGLGRLMVRNLRAAGFEAEHVTDGDSAMAALAAQRFHAVALDHNLGGESGLDLLPRIKALPEAPPVIFVTGSDDARVAVAALKNGAIDYVWKDVQGHYRELLVTAINTALEQEELRRAKERADEEVRAGKRRAELLLAEVNHRVANSLGIVMSLARLQAAASSNAAVIDAMEEMQARVSAIAGVHRRLYTSVDIRYVDVDTYLQGLIEEMNGSLHDTGHSRQIIFTASTGLLMPTDKVISVGIAMNELVTNARKYAYPPGTPAGEIRASLELLGPAQARLTVEDDGIGWKKGDAVKGSGVGSQIVAAMAGSLRAELSYPPREKGTCVALEFPVEPKDGQGPN
ncbi:response regulator [Acetobacteraceae bacterium H6797]|nr:response regulator [Acetobacteraceae bacterium H6797]